MDSVLIKKLCWSRKWREVAVFRLKSDALSCVRYKNLSWLTKVQRVESVYSILAMYVYCNSKLMSIGIRFTRIKVHCILYNNTVNKQTYT